MIFIAVFFTLIAAVFAVTAGVYLGLHLYFKERKHD